jgi:hypothetical protein
MGKYLNAGDCLGAGRQVKQLQRPSVPVGGRRRNRGGGAWPWFATPSLLPAAVVARVVAGKNQSPRDGRKKKARNKCCRLCPPMLVNFLVVMLLVVEVAQAVVFFYPRGKPETDQELKDAVALCLSEDAVYGLCTHFEDNMNAGPMANWDVSDVTDMTGGASESIQYFLFVGGLSI